MVKPYIHSVFHPFVANIFRTAGILPLSWRCDDQGLPVFSPGLFFYSLSLMLVVGLLYLFRCLFVFSEDVFLDHIIQFYCMMITLLIILPSTIQCKRGLTRNILTLLKKADAVMNYNPGAQPNHILLPFPLILVVSLLINIKGSQDICEKLFYNVITFIIHSNYLALYYSVGSIKTRLEFINNYIYQRCTTRTVDHLAEKELSLPALRKTHYLLTEAIFIMNSHSGLQLLASFIFATDSTIHDNIIKIKTTFHTGKYPNTPKDYSLEILKYIFVVTQVVCFTTVLWICSDTTDQAKKLFYELAKIKKKSLGPVTRKQVKTLQLQLPYHCTEFSAAGLITVHLSVVSSFIAVMLFNIVFNIIQE